MLIKKPFEPMETKEENRTFQINKKSENSF